MRALAVAFVLLAGCTRKAPGPRECQDLAIALSGVRTLAELQVPAVRDAVNRVTVDCLVTPYDRELLRCIQESGHMRSCKREFDRRLLTSRKTNR